MGSLCCWWLEVLSELVRLHSKRRCNCLQCLFIQIFGVMLKDGELGIFKRCLTFILLYIRKSRHRWPISAGGIFLFRARRRHKVQLSNAFHGFLEIRLRMREDLPHRPTRPLRLFPFCPDRIAACDLPLPGAEDSCLIFRDPAGQHRYASPSFIIVGMAEKILHPVFANLARPVVSWRWENGLTYNSGFGFQARQVDVDPFLISASLRETFHAPQEG